MKQDILGIIDATTYHIELEDLIVHRDVSAIPFGGRYRLIDFVLSNMVNSGIESVAIFPRYQYRSLMDHLGSGKNWDLNRKRDGLFFFPSPAFEHTNEQGIGSFDHFYANLDFFFRSRQEYSLISNCFTVFNMDFQPVLAKHIGMGCDITEIRHNQMPLEMYLVKTSLLIDLIKNRQETGYHCMKDVVSDVDSVLNVCHYEYDGFVRVIDSIGRYYAASMDMLEPNIWKQMFMRERPIYTKVKDEPPARYLSGASVKNSIVANGCLIEGVVENCIISRGVKIGKGAVVKNSIIMQKSQIGENCVIDSAILDKDVKIDKGTVVTGATGAPTVIRKGTIKGALVQS